VTAKVVDSSALAALTYQEPGAAAYARQLDGHELHAPYVLRFEMANVCIKKVKMSPADRNRLVGQHHASLGVQVNQHPVDQAEVLALALRFNLSAYDASFLWLAAKLNVELVTGDDSLTKADKRLRP
jgi:predicted nucleic acid-binding protein